MKSLRAAAYSGCSKSCKSPIREVGHAVISESGVWVIGMTTFLRFPLNGLAQQSASGKEAAQTTVTAFPKDVCPDSGFWLPLLKRENLDHDWKKMYDLAVNLNSRTLAGLQGPSRILLYSPKLAQLERELNQYLRYKPGSTPVCGNWPFLLRLER